MRGFAIAVRDGIGRARSLRRAQTEHEAILWRALRNRQFDGFKFRRQVPIDRYIADFACVEANLIVELDGGQHAAQTVYDAERTAALEARGFHVLRFWNLDLKTTLDGVVETVRRALHRDFG